MICHDCLSYCYDFYASRRIFEKSSDDSQRFPLSVEEFTTAGPTELIPEQLRPVSEEHSALETLENRTFGFYYKTRQRETVAARVQVTGAQAQDQAGPQQLRGLTDDFMSN